MRQLEWARTRDRGLAEGHGGQRAPDLRQQQRHRRGGQPRRGRRWAWSTTTTTYRFQAGEPRHPEPQPLLPRRRPRLPADPVDGQRARRAPTRPSEASRFLEFLLTEESQRYFSDETFEYPLVAGGARRLRAAPARPASHSPDYRRRRARRRPGAHGGADRGPVASNGGLSAARACPPGPPAADGAPRGRPPPACPLVAASSAVVAALFAAPLGLPGRPRG